MPLTTPIMGAIAGGDNLKCALMMARYSVRRLQPGYQASRGVRRHCENHGIVRAGRGDAVAEIQSAHPAAIDHQPAELARERDHAAAAAEKFDRGLDEGHAQALGRVG